MRNKGISVRGALMRDMIQDVTETSWESPLRPGSSAGTSGTGLGLPVGYLYEIIERDVLHGVPAARGRGHGSGGFAASRGRLHRSDEEHLPEIRGALLQTQLRRTC